MLRRQVNSAQVNHPLLKQSVISSSNIQNFNFFQFLFHCTAAKDSYDIKAIFFVSEFQRIVSSGYNCGLQTSGRRYYNTSASDKSRGTSVANSSKVLCVCAKRLLLFIYGGHQFSLAIQQNSLPLSCYRIHLNFQLVNGLMYFLWDVQMYKVH